MCGVPLLQWLMLICFTTVIAERDYIFTCPTSLEIGKTEKLSLALLTGRSPGQVVIDLMDSKNKVYTRHIVKVTSGTNKWIAVEVPFRVAPGYNESSGNLVIRGTFEDTNDFTRSTKVQIVTLPSQRIFIQTEKPVYKPSQEIKFRILVTDYFMKGVSKHITVDVWITNEAGIRMMQWLKQTFDTPIIQLSVQLSDHPPLGTWTINVLTSTGVLKTQTVRIEEYVLPKYEVKITPPPYVLRSERSFKVKICGVYTNGQPVSGSVVAVAGYYGTWLGPNPIKNPPVASVTDDIHGCYDWTINQGDLKWQHRTFLGYSILINATISEAGTDVSRTSSATVTLESIPVIITFQPNKQQYYKPGIPYFGSVLITNPDKSPRKNEPIEICVTAVNFPHGEGCKNFTSNIRGNIKFSFFTDGNTDKEIIVKAKATNFPDYYSPYYSNLIYLQPTGHLYLTPWHSLSGNYLQILDSSVTCNKVLTINTLTTTNIKNQDVFYEVVSRGNIVSVRRQFVKEVIKGVRKISEDFILNSTMANQKTYRIFFIRHIINITPDLTPRIRVIVYYAQSNREIIADERAFEIKNCFSNNVKFSFQKKIQHPGTNANATVTASPKSFCGVVAVDKSVYLKATSGQLTINTLTGILEEYDISNYIFHNPICWGPDPVPTPNIPLTNMVDSETAFQNGRVIVLTNLIIHIKPCVTRPPSTTTTRAPVIVPPVIPQPPKFQTRNSDEFRETFLWQLVDVSTGRRQITGKLPNIMTTFQGNAVCINSDTGLGISPLASIITYKPIFVSISLPFSVIRGETVAITISVFNYEKKAVAVTLTLIKTASFDVINGTTTSTFCVKPGVRSKVVYLIAPTKLGVINVTATATAIKDMSSCGSVAVPEPRSISVSAKDTAITPLVVKSDGYIQRKSQNTFICAENNTMFATLTLVVPNGIIEGSLVAQISVTGVVLGAALNNIEKLIQAPTGCGEQNMIGFAPDVYIYNYLLATGGLTPALKDKLIKFMLLGYQRQLFFRRTDSSYSAFGQRDKIGSIWLSAFVIQVFKDAQKYIFINQVDIDKTGLWIVNQQGSNGCFPQIGSVIHRDLLGGVGTSSSPIIALSAFIIASLIQANQISSAKLALGMKCLKQEPNPELYTLALITYAFALAEDPEADATLQSLLDKSVNRNGLMHWNASTPSVRVEIASYVILSLIKIKGKNGVGEALPIIRWLVTQSNANGGFYSSQDTVLGIKAMSAYASLVLRGSTKLLLTIRSGNGVANERFEINDQNKLLQQIKTYQEDLEFLTVRVTGRGCALVQYSLQYNVPVPSNQSSFTIAIQATRSVLYCKTVIVSVCLKYTGKKAVSDMALLEVNLVSGYSADRDTLNSLLTIDTLAFKKYDYDKSKIVFYFEQVAKVIKCFTFNIHQDFVVANAKNGTAKIYDYYQINDFATANLNIQGNCP